MQVFTGGYVFYVPVFLHVKCKMSITEAMPGKAGLMLFFFPRGNVWKHFCGVFSVIPIRVGIKVIDRALGQGSFSCPTSAAWGGSMPWPKSLPFSFFYIPLACLCF